MLGELSQFYKIRLASGRVLGPLGGERIVRLIAGGALKGTEDVKVYPNGTWKSFHEYSELWAIFLEIQTMSQSRRMGLAKAAGAESLSEDVARSLSEKDLSQEEIEQPPKFKENGVREIALPEEPSLSIELEGTGEVDAPRIPSTNEVSKKSPLPEKLRHHEPSPFADEQDRPPIMDLDATQVREDQFDDGGTQIREEDEAKIHRRRKNLEKKAEIEIEQDVLRPVFPHDATVVIQHLPIELRSTDSRLVSKNRKSRKDPIGKGLVRIFLIIGLVVSAIDVLEEEMKPAPKPKPQSYTLVPKLPPASVNKPNPNVAQRLTALAIKPYFKDTVMGYRQTEHILKKALLADPSNSQALALLASVYMNLVDSSNKDEKYFGVVQRLIDLARASGAELLETVIADVEFLLLTGRAKSAYERINSFTKRQDAWDAELYYYAALALRDSGEFLKARENIAKFLSKNQASPKARYLVAQLDIDERNEEGAVIALTENLKIFPDHARSRVLRSRLYIQMGSFSEASRDIALLSKKLEDLTPPELADLHDQRGQLAIHSNKDLKKGLISAKNAIRLMPKKHDYYLTFYTLQMKLGKNVKQLRDPARFYYFMQEGEKAFKNGDKDGALFSFLQAQQLDEKSALVRMRIGDLYWSRDEVNNAKMYYEDATKLSKDDNEAWSKFLQALIASYEFKRAEEAVALLRKRVVKQSFLDRVTGDLFARQGLWIDAIRFYRSAMGRNAIDPGVYASYADALVATGNGKEAAFFYSLARRLDPSNLQAVAGSVRAIAETESLERAIRRVPEEIKLTPGRKPELLTILADLQLRNGDRKLALETAESIKSLAPFYGGPYKVIAQVHMSEIGRKKSAEKLALEALKSYSDRTPSDPFGYIERYKIFLGKNQLREANGELENVFAAFPNYPDIHVMRGNIYEAAQRFEEALQEYQLETKVNPRSRKAYLALGKVQLKLGRHRDALVAFVKAMELAPQSAEPRQLAGHANELLGQRDAAVALYQSAIQLDPNFSVAHKRLGATYLALGDLVKMRESFRRYLELEPDAPDANQIRAYVK